MDQRIELFKQSLVIMGEGMFGILLFMSFFYGIITVLMKWGHKKDE